MTLMNLSILAKERGDPAQAIEYAREAAAISAPIYAFDGSARHRTWKTFGALADELRMNDSAEEAWRGLPASHELRYPDGSHHTA